MSQQWIDQKYDYDSTLNISYGIATDFNGQVDTLLLDLYMPQCDDATHLSRRPLMLWFHGGAFIEGDKSDPGIATLCRHFAKRGYVTASIGYRKGFVCDDQFWTCNYPGYSCIFAADSAEWIRAWYRAVQDGKGALRYLLNRHQQFRIDTMNVFLAGESAGSFIALGIGLLDTLPERLPQTYAITSVPSPNPGTFTCAHNMTQSFFNPVIPRPDLGSLEGVVEPSSVEYVVKGIGNIFGGMMNDLLEYHPYNKPLPAIYSFHQPCDLVVPIDSGKVFQLFSWCMTNGYGCYAIANTPKIYGSRGFSQWNTVSNYGYNIHNEFTATNFPYSYLFGAGSCSDQVNNPCHYYDSPSLRENNMAAFFAPLVSTFPVCDTGTVGLINMVSGNSPLATVSPNPIEDKTTILYAGSPVRRWVADIFGREVICPAPCYVLSEEINTTDWSPGIYHLYVIDHMQRKSVLRIVKADSLH